MFKTIAIFALVGISLAGCGTGVSTPEQLRGTWSDSCPTGKIEIGEDELQILYPEKKEFDLTSSNFDGKSLTISFKTDGKTVTDVFVYDGKSLSADHVITEAGTFNSDKIPMTRCD